MVMRLWRWQSSRHEAAVLRAAVHANVPQADGHCIICTGERIQRKLEEPVRMKKWSLMEIG